MIIMKRILPLLLILLFHAGMLPGQEAGSPNGFNYQAIARDFNGEEMSNVDIQVRISIYSGETGILEWREIHAVTTNNFGLFNLIIGKGTHEGGRRNYFSEIQWGSAAHYLQVDLSFNGGADFLATERHRLFSVPYAMYANTAGNAGGGGSDGDTSPANEIQSLAQTDTLILLKNPDGTTQSSLKNDFDPKNEIQDLLISDHILKITNNPDANDINLNQYLDNTDDQTLTMETDSLRISDGNAVSISELKNPESVNFYVEKKSSSTATQNPEPLRFTVTKMEGINYNSASGIFTVLHEGIYSFYLIYEALQGQIVELVVQNNNVDSWPSSNNFNEKLKISFMYSLNTSDTFYIRVTNTGTIGKAAFYGFRVY